MNANELAARLRDWARTPDAEQLPDRLLRDWAASAAETLDPLRGIGFGTDCGCRMCAATRRIDPLLAELAKLLEK